jgi:septal ring factor EnvC (AmiA/AmiB activator)
MSNPEQMPPTSQEGDLAKAKFEQSAGQRPEGRDVKETGPVAETPEKQPDKKETLVNPTSKLEDVNSRLEELDAEIEQLEAERATDTENIAAARAELGLSSESSVRPSINERLEELEAQKEELEKEKEIAETECGWEKALEILAALPKNELNIYINTGKGPDGLLLNTPDGQTIDPDITKKLAGAAEKGEKKLTESLLNNLVDLAKIALVGMTLVTLSILAGIAGIGGKSSKGK